MEQNRISCWTDDWHRGNKFTITESQWNCSYYDNCDCPTLKADPDIAGTGVIIAFVFSATLSLFSTILCLVLSRSSARTYNLLDKSLRQQVCDRVQEQLGHEQAHLWAECLYDVVLTLSDQQLVTGLAMLITGIPKLNDGSLTVYHLNIATDLAWFSSITHLLTLLVIRSFEDSVKPGAPNRTAPWKSSWSYRIPVLVRSALMVIMASLLLYCCWISGYSDWDDVDECPALCTVPYAKGGAPLRWVVVNFILILSGYSQALLMQSRSVRMWWMSKRHCLLGRKDLDPSHQQSKNMAQHTPATATVKPLTRLYAVFIYVWFFFASETYDILSAITWFILGGYWTFTDRQAGHDLMDGIELEKETSLLGFGQLVPLILLLLPLLQFSESYASKFSTFGSDAFVPN
ncbi:hypothetical protein F5B20DRAFT_564252 [Whalleya microplaca]|nr:hypothetical protein F5B20DRAFT_564252 [Whalleya microplaca]